MGRTGSTPVRGSQPLVLESLFSLGKFSGGSTFTQFHPRPPWTARVNFSFRRVRRNRRSRNSASMKIGHNGRPVSFRQRFDGSLAVNFSRPCFGLLVEAQRRQCVSMLVCLPGWPAWRARPPCSSSVSVLRLPWSTNEKGKASSSVHPS